jgi:hydroxymethylpyrimidine pyrophosphatase-like HAD family hydrolase
MNTSKLGSLTDSTPPVARHVILIDFDDTIIPWGDIRADYVPAFPGVTKAIQHMYAEGYTIGIFTSRVSPSWIAHVETTLNIQLDRIINILEANDIPYHFITAEKVPAEAYFDDKAIHVEPGTLATALAAWHERKNNGR